MSFDLTRSMERARARLPQQQPSRRTRSDAGQSRLAPRAQALLAELLSAAERPSMTALLVELGARCRAEGVPCPSRAAVYNFLPRAPVPRYRVAELPAHARAALFNLDDAADVPGPQLAFYLINHGDTRALSFAAAMPWLCLYQAERMRGFRPKSHGLLRALIAAREA